jgi:hypothetical protein
MHAKNVVTACKSVLQYLEDRQALSLTDVPQPHSAVSASAQQEERPVPAQVNDVCCVTF